MKSFISTYLYNSYNFSLTLNDCIMKLKRKAFYLCAVIILVNTITLYAQNGVKPVTLQVDISKKSTEPLKPIWAWFGYDEPNYTYMKDGKKLLTEIAQFSPVPVFVRAHHLLVTGKGEYALKWGSTNAYTEDANGNPIYDWTIVDSIFDVY